jgi:hypothetical protein
MANKIKNRSTTDAAGGSIEWQPGPSNKAVESFPEGNWPGLTQSARHSSGHLIQVLQGTGWKTTAPALRGTGCRRPVPERCLSVAQGVVQFRAKRREEGFQTRFQRREGAQDHRRQDCGEQAILDRGNALFVVCKFFDCGNKLRHDLLLKVKVK